MTWQQTPAGIYVPVPEPEPSPPVPDVAFRAPRPDELGGFLHRNFEAYIERMEGRPCPWCGAPVRGGERHETSAGFGCTKCPYRACVKAGGRFTEFGYSA